MDGAGPLLNRWHAAFAAFDDDALASLANKGLVRRARKDLETVTPTLAGPADDRLRVAVGDATVDLALPPSQSRCSCPAGGVCRHILAALIFVRESPPAGSEEPATAPSLSAAEELLAIDDEALALWAGRALVAKALRAAAFGLPAQIEEAGAVVIRLPSRNAVCRWMPGAGLAGMVCSCHAPRVCEHRVAAVLAFQAARGARLLTGSSAEGGEASAGAPRSREEVLSSVGLVLGEMVALGLSRLSRATAERLKTLSLSAHGVDLPRLERLLRSLAEEVERTLARHAQADSARTLALASRAEALRHALERRPTPALVGEHRTRYDPVGDLELVGLGARQWRTRSGYRGLTVYFWDRSASGWATWTDARPTTAAGAFDPAVRFNADGPWIGLASPSQASRSVLRLTGTWRNRSGRLSGRPSTRCLVLGPSDPADVLALESFRPLVDRAIRLFGGGLGERQEPDEVVLLAPASWGAARFDPIRQAAERVVFDAEGRPLLLVLPYLPETEQAVAAFEALETGSVRSVLGLLRFDAGRLIVEPVALHRPPKVTSLTLDLGPPAPSGTSPAAAFEDDSAEADDGSEPPIASATPLGGLLGRLLSVLESVAEGGFAAFRDLPALRGLARGAEALGLSACARAADQVLEHLERQRRGEAFDETAAARDLLRADYIVRLAAAQEAIGAGSAALDA